MIDIDPEKEGLRFVLAPSDTPASKAFLQVNLLMNIKCIYMNIP